MSGERPLSLREQVGDSLRAALLSGELRPGITYTVRTMAARFGVSATPCREAILDLCNEGLLSVYPNRGFTVVEPDPATVVHIANVRRLLEIPATVEAARTMTSIQADMLLDLADRTAFCARRGDLAGYVESDMDFHREVLALTGNPVLLELSERLRAQARLHAFPGLLAEGRLAQSADEHVGLVKAMCAEDLAAVRDLVARHIGHALVSLTRIEPLTAP